MIMSLDWDVSSRTTVDITFSERRKAGLRGTWGRSRTSHRSIDAEDIYEISPERYPKGQDRDQQLSDYQHC